MSQTDGLNGAIDLSIRGRKKKSYRFLVLAVGLFIFAAVAGTVLLVMRPTTLRIAVGPSGSDDQQLIQAKAAVANRIRRARAQAATLPAGQKALRFAQVDNDFPDASDRSRQPTAQDS